MKLTTRSLLWLSDIHLNVLNKENYQQFITKVALEPCDAILLSGDIAEPPVTQDFLQQLATKTSCPIYFVLGNHDYYGTNVDTQRDLIEKISQPYSPLYFLTINEPVLLTSTCMLAGVDGWPDGRSSDFLQCTRELYDKDHILDLIPAKNSDTDLLIQLQQLADADAAKLAEQLAKIDISNITELLVMTHVPPWYETANVSLSPRDQAELSHFTCWVFGKMLHDFAICYPQISIVHIAGHVHHASSYRIADNCCVITAAAQVGKPVFQHLNLKNLFSFADIKLILP